MNNLPPGPWKYRPCKHDDWGCVRAGDWPIANTCPPWLSEDFRSTPYGTPEYKAGPPQARAIAELLIRAEREADPTPMRPEHFAGKVNHELPGGKCLCLDWHDGQCQAFFRQPAADGDGFDYVELMVLKTVGEYRTLLRAFGIEVKP